MDKSGDISELSFIEFKTSLYPLKKLLTPICSIYNINARIVNGNTSLGSFGLKLILDNEKLIFEEKR